MAGVSPDVLVDADRSDPVEPARLADQRPAACGEDRCVRAVPGYSQSRGDAQDGAAIDDESGQRPPKRAPAQLRAGARGCGVVCVPAMPTVPAPVSAHSDQQRRRPVPEWFVREPTR